MNQAKLVTYGIIGFIAVLFVLMLTSSTFLTINSGERGVLFKRFSGGLDKENIFMPGFHIIFPWNTMFVYDVREAQIEEEMEVLSSNGLNIKVDVTVRIHPVYQQIGDLHENFGRDYLTSLVRPEVRSSVRNTIGKFTPEELYSTRRDEIQETIESDLRKNLGVNFVQLKAVLIRDIELPAKVRTAIEDKIEAEQLALKYEYILDQERKEAERKIIEANAKSEANRIISASLTDKILCDKGIDATLQLANSQNAKIVVVGGGEEGLPLILGN